MFDNYPKAYKEVVEILKYVPKEEVERIPLKILQMFSKKMDKEYEYKVDENKEFQDQILLKETKIILANIYTKYWASEKEKEQIDKIYNEAKIKVDEEKIKKYGTEVIFNKKVEYDNKTELNETRVETSDIIIYNEIKWYDKVLKFIKKIFISKK